MDTHESEFDTQQAEIDKLGQGAFKHKDDTTQKLPPDMTKAFFDGENADVKASRKAYTDSLQVTNGFYGDYIKKFNAAEVLKNNSVRTIKGVYGPSSETLKDFGQLPNKKSPGRPRKPKPPTV